jgi:hypothetical protein
LKDVRAIVSAEMDLYLNSGLSACIRFEKSNELAGCFFSTSWKRDPNYNVIENVSMKEWHNTAAEIAMEVAPERPQAVWRDYQYQHLYNVCQG